MITKPTDDKSQADERAAKCFHGTYKDEYVEGLAKRVVELEAELASVRSERDKVARGKVTCADCGSILARW